MSVKTVHRIVGLFFAVIWLVQVLSGLALTFVQETGNAICRGVPVEMRTAALGDRIRLIQQFSGQVSSAWTADFAADGGEVGEWIIAISGILLFSNLLLGLKLGWPRAGAWRQVLVLRPSRNPTLRLVSIHRALAVWMAIPALLITLAGIGLRFEDDIERSVVPYMTRQFGGRQLIVLVKRIR
jgi:uncharacterized iron-regulated membrane protein